MINFLLGVLASLIAGVLYDRMKRRGLRVKQQRFIEELNDGMARYVEAAPMNEDEVKHRREAVALEVKELSGKIFGKPYPPIESLRLESTEYPQIDCKWCQRKHKAFSGSRGDCRTCKLPLDIWIGCQGESLSSHAAPNNSFNRSAG